MEGQSTVTSSYFMIDGSEISYKSALKNIMFGKQVKKYNNKASLISITISGEG